MRVKKLWNAVQRGVNGLANLFAVICAAACLVNMVILTVDVVMRTAFHKPIAGITEYATLILMYAAYFGVAYTLIQNRHMQMTAFYEKLPPRGMAVMDCVINVVTIFVFVILTVASGKGLERSLATMETMQASVTVYRWPGRLAIVLGCVLVILVSAVRLIDALIRVCAGPDTAAERGAG